ncbi:UNVERIFIED_CONTAM: hypothetical protein GTU68_006531 [Idotea baltica]|nr:hypothetical protein [Idotea baltica]
MQTASKAFCGDNASFGGAPNTHVSTISLAHPGTLPRPNIRHVEFATRLGIALDCRINPLSHFDRKHYFYADLPKGFQTTQDSEPICLGGKVTFRVEDTEKTVRLHHIHMEEDAGKSIHDENPTATLIDLNRAGVPLLEMVTEPDFRTADEVYHFINALRRLVRYLEISDGNMEEGSLRCDCNVSVRPRGQVSLNPRSEVKNVNSARFARKAIEFEIERQIALMEQGESVIQETREFLPEQGITTSLRGKEDAHDYRYFVEPDILPIIMTADHIKRIKETMPTLPEAYRKTFVSLGVSDDDAEFIIDSSKRAVEFRDFIDKHKEIPTRRAANFFVNKWYPAVESEVVSEDMEFGIIAQFLKLIEEDKISASIAYQKLWPELLGEPQDPFQLCQKLNLMQTSDEDEITSLAREVINENPVQLAQYRKGKKGVIKFFMGQLMRRSKGKANPEIATKTLERILAESQSK